MIQRRIPNSLTLGVQGAAVAAYAVTGQGWLGLPWTAGLAGWALALALTLPGYVLKKLGAGDVKLFAAMGLLGGVDTILITFAVAGLLAGAVALLWLAAYRWFFLLALPLSRMGISTAGVPEPKGRFLPFGSALAAGFLVALFGLGSGSASLPF
ncbi:MAG TPA: hypothetical protein DCZ48_10880 [Methylococcaceae bacterium]|nr:hypothetical protein [Methylococcaceae bacterium]